VLNEVVLNQVVVRFDAGDAGDVAAGDAHTREVVSRLWQDRTCMASGTVWRGMAALRISVSNATTDEEDVDRSVDAILRAHAR
jgi:hypothetical protein